MKRFYTWALAMLLVASSSWAVVRNANTGSTDTLQTLVNAALPGDTILVKDGNFKGFVKGAANKLLGSPGMRIVIKADTVGDAIINTTGQANGNLVTTNGMKWVTFDGIRFKDAAGAGIEIPYAEYVDFVNCYWDTCHAGLGPPGTMRYVRIDSCTFTGCGGDNDPYADSHQVYLAAAGTSPWTMAGVEIKNSTFQDPAADGASQLHVNCNNRNADSPYYGLLLENCKFLRSPGLDNINFQAVKDGVVRNCFVYTTSAGGRAADVSESPKGRQGQGIWCEDITFINCTFVVPNASGITQRLRATGTRIANCIIMAQSLGACVSGQGSNPIHYLDGNNILVKWDATYADSVFVDWTNGDWRPLPGGPADGTGLVSYMGVDASTTDIDGTAFGIPDIGCYAKIDTLITCEPSTVN